MLAATVPPATTDAARRRKPRNPTEMASQLRILHATSEVAPLVKTGGLADVAAALPSALRKAGHDARVVIPGYRSAIEAAQKLKGGVSWSETPLIIEAGGIDHRVGVGTTMVDGVPVYLLGCNELYDRDGIYGPSPSNDYDDNARRYSVFAKASLALSGLLRWTPQVVHAHDWQAGMIPALLQRGFNRVLPATRSIFTIHNIAYQGAFWHFDLKLTGLDWALFNPMQLEHYQKLNFLKAGVVFADRVTTVSRRHAEEIQTAEYGYGMEAVMAGHAYKLSGITNGIDTGYWNPSTDDHLAARYSASSLAGKAACKRALREEC